MTRADRRPRCERCHEGLYTDNWNGMHVCYACVLELVAIASSRPATIGLAQSESTATSSSTWSCSQTWAKARLEGWFQCAECRLLVQGYGPWCELYNQPA